MRRPRWTALGTHQQRASEAGWLRGCIIAEHLACRAPALFELGFKFGGLATQEIEKGDSEGRKDVHDMPMCLLLLLLQRCAAPLNLLPQMLVTILQAGTTNRAVLTNNS